MKKKDNKLKELEEQCKIFKEKWQRERADMINYKKEESERLKLLTGYVEERFVEKFLPIIDSFEIAKKHLTKEQLKDASIKGIVMTGKMILDTLGIEEISYLDKIYDSKYCEVVDTVSQKGEPGTVIQDVQIGYKKGDKIIRINKVKIIK